MAPRRGAFRTLVAPGAGTGIVEHAAGMRPRQDSARGVLDERRGAQRFRNDRFWPAEDMARPGRALLGRQLGPGAAGARAGDPAPPGRGPSGVRAGRGIAVRRLHPALLAPPGGRRGGRSGCASAPPASDPGSARPVRSLDRPHRAPAAGVLGPAVDDLAVRCRPRGRQRPGWWRTFCAATARRRTPGWSLVNRVVERITADGAVLAVGDVARPFGISPRTGRSACSGSTSASGPSGSSSARACTTPSSASTAGEPADWARLAPRAGLLRPGPPDPRLQGDGGAHAGRVRAATSGDLPSGADAPDLRHTRHRSRIDGEQGCAILIFTSGV